MPRSPKGGVCAGGVWASVRAPRGASSPAGSGDRSARRGSLGPRQEAQEAVPTAGTCTCWDQQQQRLRIGPRGAFFLLFRWGVAGLCTGAGPGPWTSPHTQFPSWLMPRPPKGGVCAGGVWASVRAPRPARRALRDVGGELSAALLEWSQPLELREAASQRHIADDIATGRAQCVTTLLFCFVGCYRTTSQTGRYGAIPVIRRNQIS